MEHGIVLDDLIVEELTDIALVARGALAVYRVVKTNLTTQQVRKALAKAMDISARTIVFCTRMDQRGISVQHATLPAGHERFIDGQGFKAEYIGRCDEPVAATNLIGTRLSITFRGLGLADAQALASYLRVLEATGLPNYFDAQRLAHLPAEGAPLARYVVLGDIEGALRSYLCTPLVSDPPSVAAHKQEVCSLWPDWQAMRDAGPWPEGHAAVLAALVQYPDAPLQALRAIPRNELARQTAAYQYLLWNRITAHYLGLFYRENGISQSSVSIAREDYPVHLSMPVGIASGLANKQIDLPYARATYHLKAVAQAAREVLAAEGLQLADLGVRRVEALHLFKGDRALWIVPSDFDLSPIAPDDRQTGRHRLRLAFSLPKGSYPSLLLKIALDIAPKV